MYFSICSPVLFYGVGDVFSFCSLFLKALNLAYQAAELGPSSGVRIYQSSLCRQLLGASPLWIFSITTLYRGVVPIL